MRLFDKLNNIMLTSFKDGWYFDEIAGNRRELFSVLNVPVPDKQQAVSSWQNEGDPDDGEEAVKETGDIIGQMEL